jgi:hypothetical protein
MHRLSHVVRRCPEEHRLTVEDHCGAMLLHPVGELMRDVVDGSQVGRQPRRTSQLRQKV